MKLSVFQIKPLSKKSTSITKGLIIVIVRVYHCLICMVGKFVGVPVTILTWHNRVFVFSISSFWFSIKQSSISSKKSSKRSQSFVFNSGQKMAPREFCLINLKGHNRVFVFLDFFTLILDQAVIGFIKKSS